MSEPEAQALRPPFALKATSGLFLVFWLLIAGFPFLWIVVMSVKLPLDAFSSQALQVLLGPATRDRLGGVSIAGLAAGVLAIGTAFAGQTAFRNAIAARLAPDRPQLGALFSGILYIAVFAIGVLVVLPFVVGRLDAMLRLVPPLEVLSRPIVGFTARHYDAVWFEHAFYRQFLNSMIVTGGVVAISLTVGTLAGYALARSPSNLAFVILMIALVFRALPHSVLVTGYLPIFINSRALLQPLWDAPLLGPILQLFTSTPPTLYGKHLAVIAVLVAINQPFTIWMLRAFFRNIPSELDEAARVDGCSHFGAFWRVIVPVMWPGVITTGLFSFLLAYNDYLVTSLLLDGQSQTMVPAIAQYFNRDTSSTDQIQAVAAAVSITAPVFLLVMVFQRQIVSGLTQGAVKG